MVRGQVSRLLFLDSSVNGTGTGDRTRLLLPSGHFTATGNEQMSLTLQSFSIRRNWYNINSTNNTGYVFTNDVYYEFSIPPGTYTTFADLATAIATSLTALIAANSGLSAITSAAACTYSALTRKFTITFTKVQNVDKAIEIRCFALKQALPTGVTPQGGFNDFFEILGGRSIKTAAAASNSLELQTGTPVNKEVLISYIPAALNTMDAIYLHLPTLETGNFMSTGHESHILDSNRLVESSIFARIPFDDSTFTEVHEVIQFEDTGGDSFQSMLSRKSLEQIELRVTDPKGRSLGQAANFGPSYNAVLRFDIFVPPQPQEPTHGVKTTVAHPPSVTHK